MKKSNKFLSILLTLVMVLAMLPAFTVTASAAESKSLTVTTKDDVVNDTDGLISLREAIAYAAAGTTSTASGHTGEYYIDFDYATLGDSIKITLVKANGALTVDASTVFTAESPLTIAADTGKSVTISGGWSGGSATDGVQIMNIKASNNVTLNNLTFTKGYAENGGAISNAGNLTINDSTFTDNTATGYGGAIYNEGTLAVANSTFTGNTTTTQQGGAIYSASSTTSITTTIANSTFVGNNIAEHSSAIYNWQNGGAATLNLINNIIINNFIGNKNGTVDSYGVNYVDPEILTSASQVFTSGIDTLKSTTSSKTFANNAAPDEEPTYMTDEKGNMLLKYLGDADGKGVYVHKDAAGNIGWSSDGETITWLSGTTHENVTEISVKGMGGKPNAGSGATSSSENSLTVNTLYDVFNPHDGLVSLREAIVYASNGTTSTAEGHTGEYYIDFDYAKLGDTFTIALANGTLAVDASDKFTAEKPLTIAADTGKSVTIDGGNTFASGVSQNDGVQIMTVAAGSNVTLNNLTFTKGYADYGGAINNTLGTLTINNCTFTNNTANGGGAIYNTYDNQSIIKAGTVTINGGSFTNNTVTGSGGAVYNGTEGQMTITDATFTGNSAKNDALYSYPAGGAIYTNGNLTITGGSFTNNTATNKGGAISNGKVLTINGATFSGNSADVSGTEGGGAIYNYGTTLTIQKNGDTGTIFTGNTATNGAGGAIYNKAGKTLTITGATFTDNTAAVSGGAIYNLGTLAVNDGLFTDNTATEGGAIYTDGGIINGATFTGNSAGSSGCGGAICNAGELYILNSTFTDNTAKSGQAFYAYMGTMNLVNNIIIGNGSAAGVTKGDKGTIYGYGINIVDQATIDSGDITVKKDGTKIGELHYGTGYSVSDLFVTDGSGAATVGTDGLVTIKAGDAAKGGAVYTTAAGVYTDITIVWTAAGAAEPATTVVTGTETTANKINLFDADRDYAGYGKLIELVCKIGNVGYVTVQDAVNAAQAGDTIVMIDDSTENVNVAAGKNVTLDLNGYVLKSVGYKQDGSVITNNGTLTVKDSGTTAVHNFKVGSDGRWTLTDETKTVDYESLTARPEAGAVVAVKGGCITGDGTWDDGGGILNCGTLTLEGGNIIGNKAGTGGGIRNEVKHSMTMTGGNIIGNISSSYGGGIANNGKLTMSDGYICYNITGSQGGAGVMNTQNYGTADDGTFIMTGGEISHNCTNGSNGAGLNFYSSGNGVSVGGTAKIIANVDNSGKASNLFLSSGKTLTVLAGFTGTIGVTTQTTPTADNPVAITSASSTDYSNSFFSDNSAYYFINDGTESNQVVKLLPHVHSWTYDVDSTDTTGATLKAECSNADQRHTGSTTETLTIQAPSDLTYSGTEKAASFKDGKTSLGGLTFSGDDIKYYKKNAAGTDWETDPLTTAPTVPGTYRASITVGTNTAYVDYTIEKKELTVSGAEVYNKGYDGTTAASISYEYADLVGIVGVDKVDIASASASFVDKNAGDSIDVIVTYTLKGDDAGYYTVKDSETSATISQAQLTVTGTTVNGKTYDGTKGVSQDMITLGTVSGIVGNDVVTVTPTAEFPSEDAGNGYDVTVTYSLSGADAANYAAPSSDTTYADIEKRPVTLKSADLTKSYDGTALAGSGDVTDLTAGISGEGYVSGEEFSYSFTGSQLSVGNSANSFTVADSATATVVNYDITKEEGSLTVTQNDTLITITADDAGKTYDGTALEKNGYTYTGSLAAGDSFTSVTVVGTTTAAGTAANKVTAYTITNQAGDDVTNYYSNIQSVDGTLTVSPKQLTVTGSAVSGKTYDGTTAAVVTAGTPDGIIAGDDVTVTATGAFDDAEVGENKPVTITYALSGADAGNYLAPVSEQAAATIAEAVTYIHTVKADDAENGKVTMEPAAAAAGKTVTLTVTPDKGYTLETITVLNAAGKEIELTAVKEGETFTFKMPAGNVTVKATFMEDNTMLNYFVDVTADDYFYDAVLWAAENGITAGIDNLHFGPDETATRAQMVTFLWNAAGCPVVDYAMSFTDVSEDAWYAEAVRWAVSEGITSGTSETTFSPNAIVNRAQAVTFLWNAAKAPKFANMTAEGPAPSPFEDVATDAYYYNAVLWAKAEGITSGTSDTTFSPADECIRAQIVTFLYNNSVK